jgi:hypothetical protein
LPSSWTRRYALPLTAPAEGTQQEAPALLETFFSARADRRGTSTFAAELLASNRGDATDQPHARTYTHTQSERARARERSRTREREREREREKRVDDLCRLFPVKHRASVRAAAHSAPPGRKSTAKHQCSLVRTTTSRIGENRVAFSVLGVRPSQTSRSSGYAAPAAPGMVSQQPDRRRRPSLRQARS